ARRGLHAHHHPGRHGPSGGIFNTGGNIPPYAVFVVQVAGVAAAAAQAGALPGKVVVAPMQLEDGMVVAYLTDPDGSMLGLFSPKPDSCPARDRVCPPCSQFPSRKEIGMTGTASPALQTALAYYDAWTSHDLDRAMSYIAGDIVCDTPAG